MKSPYVDATRFRRISRYLAGLLFLCAAWRLMTPVIAAADPLWVTARLSCTPACTAAVDPIGLLDREMQDAARTRPDVEQKIREGAGGAGTRMMIVAARAVKAIPETLFLLSLAFAAMVFARSGVQQRSLRWLRRAAWSALAWPFAGSVAHALNSLATTPMVLDRREMHLGIYPQDLILGLILAGGLWLVIWALDEALRVRSEIDDYV